MHGEVVLGLGVCALGRGHMITISSHLCSHVSVSVVCSPNSATFRVFFRFVMASQK